MNRQCSLLLYFFGSVCGELVLVVVKPSGTFPWWTVICLFTNLIILSVIGVFNFLFILEFVFVVCDSLEMSIFFFF